MTHKYLNNVKNKIIPNKSHANVCTLYFYSYSYASLLFSCEEFIIGWDDDQNIWMLLEFMFSLLQQFFR